MESFDLVEKLNDFFKPTGDIHKIEDYQNDIILNKNGLKGFDVGVSTCLNHFITDKVEVDVKDLNDKYKNIECYWSTKNDRKMLIFVLNLYDKYYYFSLDEQYWFMNTENKTYH